MSALTEFACLWCGRPHTPRAADDVEVFAQLCPDCIGRAQENEFLRFRLKEGLRARSAARTIDVDAQLKAYYAARTPEYDDWYLRRGAHSHGPLADVAWQADLDAATLWLDALPWQGEIVELAAGTGWWSPLLASKGELSLYDAVPEPLDLARDRLVAHGLRAHIHLRDAWAEPDRQVDGLFTGFWLSHVPRPRLAEFLDLVRRWLKPGGLFAFIDEAPGPGYTATVDGLQTRSVADGREFSIPKIYWQPQELAVALAAAGFDGIEVRTTARQFLLGKATV